MSYLTLKCVFVLLRQKRKLSQSSVIHQTGQVKKYSTPQSSPAQSLKQQKFLFDPTQSRCKCIVVKVFLMAVSLFFLTFGVTVSWLVFSHFDKSKRMCQHPKLNVVTEHPELYLWDQCKYQTFPFKSFDFSSNNKINCNCRQAKIDLSWFSTSFSLIDDYDDVYSSDSSDNSNDTTESHGNTSSLSNLHLYNSSVGCTDMNNICLMIESALIHWDMLEIMYIEDSSARVSMSLNDSSHYNSIYLKILHVKDITIEALGNDIDKWENLEYFYLSHAHFTQWPNSFNKLNQISFFKIEDSYVETLPPNLCSMINLRAFSIYGSFTHYSSLASVYNHDLPNCIVNLDKLQSIVFLYAKIHSFPVGLFNMPSIAEVGFVFTEATLDSFLSVIRDTINSNPNAEFTWNDPSQTVYFFSSSYACTEYNSRTYNQTVQDSAEFEVFKQFMANTNACQDVCDAHSIQKLHCLPFEWGNGVCNEECNGATCYFDGGDCHQLCQEYSPNCTNFLDLNLFGNGVCDIGCNTTYCGYDNYQCIDNNFNITFPKNMSYCNINVTSTSDQDEIQMSSDTSRLCDTEWVGDNWCDNNCLTSDACFNDDNDCVCQTSVDLESNCQSMMGWWSLVAATNQVSLDRDSVCAVWTFVIDYGYNADSLVLSSSLETAAAKALLEYIYSQPNCTNGFNGLNINNDQFIDVTEFIETFHQTFNLTYEKAAQINCTFAQNC